MNKKLKGFIHMNLSITGLSLVKWHYKKQLLSLHKQKIQGIYLYELEEIVPYEL